MYVENVVIGKPLIPDWMLLAIDEEDFEKVEKEKTYYTEERFLHRILVDLGIYPSISEIRRNRKDLMITLDKVDFLDKKKVAKNRWLWIVVGE